MSNTTKQNQDKQRLNSKAATSSSDDEGEKKIVEEIDDSLADFRSPKITPKNPPKILNNGKKPGPRCSKKKSNNTAGQSSRVKKTTNQPSIESTFFKQQSKTSFTCPLCFKSFNDVNTQVSHSKNCATKNNVSTRKLLAATELQERQANERLELGLPAGPVRSVKRKTSSNIKSMIPAGGDPDIHLAMALSMSLKEMKQLEEFDEAVALVAESDDKFLEMSSSQRRSTLQSFGFKTNKPVIEAPFVKPKRRKNIGPTILETRTKETREQIITEKIAEIIVGIEQTTQARYTELNPPPKEPKETKIYSKLLNKLHRSDQKLWNHSKTLLKKSDYYVPELAEFFKASEPDETQNTGSNSQENINKGEEEDDDNEMVVDTDTEEKSEKVIEINSAIENKVTLQRSIVDDTDQSQLETEQERVNDNSSIEDDEDVDENEWKTDSIKDNFMKNKKDKMSSVAVAYDWYKMVGSTYGSDVKILLKDDKYLPAHSIVFLARCNDVLNDIEECNKLYDKWKQVIRWQTIDITAATIFLEYLYCGRFVTACTSNAKDQLKSLAQRYNVKELCDYFKGNERDESKCREKLVKIDEKKKVESLEKSQDLNDDDADVENGSVNLMDEIENGNRENSEDVSGSNVQDNIINNQMENKEEEEDDVWADDSDFEMEFEEKIQDKKPESQFDLNRKRMTCSPDLFEESLAFQSDGSPSINISVPDKTHDKSSHSTNKDTTPPDITDEETEKTENTQCKSYTQVNSETPCSKLYSDRRKLPEKLLPKCKSDMTLFIEKVERLNARDILDSDTDDDILIKNSTSPLRKNPFKIRKDGDDSLFLFKKKSSELNNDNKSFIEEKKKTNVSLIEEKIRARTVNNLKKFPTVEENVDTGELSSEIESDNSDDLGQSMFSKYQKQNASNSIVNYRELAKKYLLNTAELRTPPDSFEDSSLKIDDTSLEDDREISAIGNINLDEFSEMDMKEAIENSLADKNRAEEKDKDDREKKRESQENLENKPDSLIDLTQLSDFEFEESQQEHLNISDPNPAGMEVDDVYSSSSRANKTPENNQKSIKNSEAGLSSVNTDDLEFDSWSDASKFAASPLTQSRVRNSPDRELASQKNPEDNDLSQDSNYNSDNESEHCVTQNLQQSQEIEDINKESPLEFDPEINFSPLRLTQSPITLSSCSEASKLDNDLDGLSQICEENNENNSGENHQGEFGITNLLNSPIIPRKETPSTSRNITFRSKILKERPLQSYHTLSDNSDDDLPVASSTRCHSSLASPFVEKKTSSRYLAVKSKSDGNFVGSLEKKKTNSINKKINLSRVSDVITPPLDYDGMTSPELHKELDKYGLKKQKRSKAKKLLINIYDKLHPFVSDENSPGILTNNYLDNEPPRKKQCLENNYEDSDEDNLSQESLASNSSIIPEEMEIDEQNYSSINQDNLTIKELFNKFIKKDKNIHIKILTYEPLPLEDLFKKLKAEGFNGNLNELMDFLDDESITFQVQETNRNKNRQRKIKKTTQKK